ncbi:hypothetical protein Tco_0666630 [Tanacetum coccineum]
MTQAAIKLQRDSWSWQPYQLKGEVCYLVPLTEEALSGGISLPAIGIEEAYLRFTWVEYKMLLGYDLTTYVRDLQELATLCLHYGDKHEKLIEAFPIGGLPRSLKEMLLLHKPQNFGGSH